MVDVSPTEAQIHRQERRRHGTVLVLLLPFLGVVLGFSSLNSVDPEPCSASCPSSAVEVSAIEIHPQAFIAQGGKSLLPGASRRQQVTVRNVSAQALWYGLTLRGEPGLPDSPDLAAALDITIRTMATDCTSFNGELLAAGSASTLTRQESLFGARPLGAGEREDLCVEVALPGVTGNAYQGAMTRLQLAALAASSR